MTFFPRQAITRIGDLEQRNYFIRKGVVRKFFYKGKREITTQLCMEGVCCSVSFPSGAPSDYVLETLEPGYPDVDNKIFAGNTFFPFL